MRDACEMRQNLSNRIKFASESTSLDVTFYGLSIKFTIENYSSKSVRVVDKLNLCLLLKILENAEKEELCKYIFKLAYS